VPRIALFSLVEYQHLERSRRPNLQFAGVDLHLRARLHARSRRLSVPGARGREGGSRDRAPGLADGVAGVEFIAAAVASAQRGRPLGAPARGRAGASIETLIDLFIDAMRLSASLSMPHVVHGHHR
jgi:hypothetical protein